MGENVSQLLEPIAAWFRNLGMPAPIIHWGHPLMMGIVVFVLGSYVAYAGWRSRISTDGEVVFQSRANHRQLAPWMFLFIALGYTGGVLSLVMQQQPIFESPHFWTGSIVVILLGTNGTIAATGFGSQQKGIWRNVHAYLGSAVMILLIVHAVLGFNLGLSLEKLG